MAVKHGPGVPGSLTKFPRSLTHVTNQFDSLLAQGIEDAIDVIR